MCWEGCARVRGVSGEVCWHMGKVCGDRNGGIVGKCVWAPTHFSTSPFFTSLPSPFPAYLPHTQGDL